MSTTGEIFERLRALEEKVAALEATEPLRIGTLTVGPGEALVVRFDKELPSGAYAHARETLRKAFGPDVTAILLSPGVELSKAKVERT